MSIDRNSAAVVCNAHTVPRQKCYFDVVRESAHRFIARVVKDFPDEVLKAGGPRRPNVHARASAHRVPPFKNRNVFSSVRRTPGFGGIDRRLFRLFFSHILWLQCSRNGSKMEGVLARVGIPYHLNLKQKRGPFLLPYFKTF